MKTEKLTKEDLQFIDNYLINNNVKFTDIKAEMHDHIATAVENKMNTENLDFYDAFKEYMVLNKKEIMKMNKESSLDFSFSTFTVFGKELINPFRLLILALIFSVYYYYYKIFDFSDYKVTSYFFGFFILFVFASMILMYLIYWRKKIRIYQLEKNFSILFIFQQVFNPVVQFKNNEIIAQVGLIIMLYLTINYVLFFYKGIQKYQTNLLP